MVQTRRRLQCFDGERNHCGYQHWQEYGIKNKMCHICQRREKLGKDAKTHDCRKNFSGSAKSMEPAICEELFANDKYKVMIGDEDSSSEALVKRNINEDIEKWADVNHVKRTLGKTLHY